MAFRSIAARFWLSFASYEKPPTILCTQRAGLKHRGFPAAKHMQQKMATPSHLKENTKQNGESFTIEIIFGLHIYIYIYILFICCLWLQTKTSKSFFSVTSAMPHVVTGGWHCWHWLSPAMGHRANLSLGYVSRSTLRMIRQRFSWPLGISLYKRARRLAVLLGTKKSHLVQQKAQLLTDTPEQTKTWKKWKQC